MTAIAIITARGGSKRIPKKNIKEFCGKPIIAYSIQAAQKSGLFDEIMVSTDSEEIAKISLEYGAKVPFYRSAETSNDYAVTADVLKEVIGNYNSQGIMFDYMTCIYPTAPFVTSEILIESMNLLKKYDADTVHPVVQYSYPPQRAYWIKDNQLKWVSPQYELTRSQDLEAMYHDCGQFYCLDVKTFMESGKIIGKKTIPIIISEMQAQDIDNDIDWKLAETKYRILNKF